MDKKTDIHLLINDMANGIQNHCKNLQYKNPLMIGIQRGGVWVATQLHMKLNYKDPLSELNIAFYRDDFSKIGDMISEVLDNINQNEDNKNQFISSMKDKVISMCKKYPIYIEAF